MTKEPIQHYKPVAVETTHESAQPLLKIGAEDKLILSELVATGLQSYTTITSTELSRKPSEALLAANTKPVFITNRGQVTHVLLSMAEHQKISKQSQCLGDLLACDDGGFDFEQYLPSRT